VESGPDCGRNRVRHIGIFIYYHGPDLEEQHWYWITPGSIIGVLLWIAASFGFRAYLHFFNTYSKTYGSLGAAMILLMWLYITGFLS
jgi:membrane protein